MHDIGTIIIKQRFKAFWLIFVVFMYLKICISSCYVAFTFKFFVKKLHLQKLMTKTYILSYFLNFYVFTSTKMHFRAMCPTQKVVFFFILYNFIIRSFHGKRHLRTFGPKIGLKVIFKELYFQFPCIGFVKKYTRQLPMSKQVTSISISVEYS